MSLQKIFKKKIIFLLLIILIGIAYSLKSFIPNGIKNQISKMFIFKRLEKIDNKVAYQKKIINNYGSILREIANGYLLVEQLLVSKRFGKFIKKKFIIEDKFFLEFKSIRSRWNVMESFDDNIIFTYHDGSTVYFKASELDNSKININEISTNLSNFIDYKINNENNNVLLGVRDTFLHEDGELYVSILQRMEEDCTGIIIVRSKMNLKNMNFEVFYEQPNDCSSRSLRDENDWKAGGALSASWNGNIALSIGDLNTFTDAQENKNLLGKIIEIDSFGKINRILALGLRNPTSLYLKEKNIFITVIGPQSGDEINNLNLDDNLPVNFGWPYATYGNHDLKVDFKYSSEHKLRGFKEPLFYGTPKNSITPSALIISDDFFIESEQMIVATLKERSLMIFKIVRNTEGELMNLDLLEQISFDTRIRDLLIIGDKMILSMEDQVEIVVLSR